MEKRGFLELLFDFLGRSVKYVLLTVGALIVLLIGAALLMPDSDDNGNDSQATPPAAIGVLDLQEEQNSEPTRVIDSSDGGGTVTGYDDVEGNPDAALDVPFDEQSTVVLGE